MDFDFSLRDVIGMTVGLLNRVTTYGEDSLDNLTNSIKNLKLVIKALENGGVTNDRKDKQGEDV